MVDQPDAVTLAVVVARLDDLREDISGIRADIATSRDAYVSRGEWGQRNSNVDNRFQALGRELGDLRTEVRAARAPWYSVAAVLVAAVALGWNVVAPLFQS